MSEFYVSVGDQVSFAKTVGESDVYLFAGITGDFSGNHVDEEFMKRSVYGRRIAHGVLLVGYMSTCSTMMIEQGERNGAADETPVSLGYDRIRFLGRCSSATRSPSPTALPRSTRSGAARAPRSRCAISTASWSRSPSTS